MQNDPENQARQLAGVFSRMAAAVDDYRTGHFDELSEEQRALLEKTEDRLADIHDRLIAIAIEGTLGALAGDMSRIAAVTREAKQSLRTLKRYADVVKIASAAIDVGAAALSGDTGMIATSIEDLAQMIPNLAKKPQLE
ncbi:MAG: hypothetical protein ACRD4O_08580, partial [Bryobacteraceae bacterium]